jgi:hypothetical protein
MKQLFTFFLLAFSFYGFAQVSGEIATDKRKALKEIDFTVPYSKPGILVFSIAVNKDGKVTSCVLDEKKSTITSTSVMVKAKNKIMSQLAFEKGIGHPEWHRGFVTIKTVQTENTEPNKFSPPN